MLTKILISFFLAAPATSIRDLAPRMEHAVVTASAEQLEQCRALALAALHESSGAEANQARYAIAYLDWRLYPLLLYRRETKARADASLQDAIAQLKELLETDPKNAEANALLASVYGQQIAASAWKGMILGPKSTSHTKTALEAAPQNPRVVLQAGVGEMFTPRGFGGGIAKAERDLRRAELLYSQEASDAPWPNWGRLDVLAWMGQLLAAKGDREGARAYYQRALRMEPDYAWVRDILLPALDKLPGRK